MYATCSNIVVSKDWGCKGKAGKVMQRETEGDSVGVVKKQ